MWGAKVEEFVGARSRRASTRHALGLRTSQINADTAQHYAGLIEQWVVQWATHAEISAGHQFRLSDLASVQAFFAAHETAARTGRGRARAEAERRAGGVAAEAQVARSLLEHFVGRAQGVNATPDVI